MKFQFLVQCDTNLASGLLIGSLYLLALGIAPVDQSFDDRGLIHP